VNTCGTPFNTPACARQRWVSRICDQDYGQSL
jgi:hypothetical protein